VTDVGHEVAAHALDPSQLRDVSHEGDRADQTAAASEWQGADLEHLAGWTEQLELAFGTFTSERRPKEFTNRVLDERVGVACAAEALTGGVAQHLSSLRVDDDHAILERRQRSGE
jgi:hypothetical protein